MTCDFSLDLDDRGMVAARLCDVFSPSGEARLVTHGVRNLCRDDRGAVNKIHKGKR